MGVVKHSKKTKLSIIKIAENSEFALDMYF
jgi:hypothetical protein